MKLLHPAAIILSVCLVASSANAQYQPQQQPVQYQPAQGQLVQRQPVQPQPVQQPGKGQPGPPQAGQGFVPQPFQLNQVEQTYLDQVLDQWEKQSDQVSNFHSSFSRLVYDAIFSDTQYKTHETGELSYQKPDKGSYKITNLKSWDAARGDYTEVKSSETQLDHWVCNGKSIFVFDTRQKQLVERPIPPELQGKNIVDSPLPFIFGAKADKLKEKYWMRVDHRSAENQIRIVAAPKQLALAKEYRYVELMLDKQKFLPTAMQVHRNNGDREVYTFDIATAQVNNRINQLWNQMFQTPRTPFGWKKIVEQPQAQQMAQPNQGAALR